MKENTRVLLSLGAGLAGGALIAASGDARLLRAADAIVPIGTIWINAIRMTIVPLIVSLLITGVAGAADLRSIGKLGGRSLLTFLLLLIGCAIVIMPIGIAAFRLLGPNTARPPLPPGAAEAAGQIAAEGAAPGFAAWVTSLLPTNPIAAAANGAMLQLILFTLILALAIAKTAPNVREPLLAVFRGLSEAMLVIVRWVVALAPLGIFALVLPLAARGGAGVVGAVGFYIVAYSVASILIIALLYPVVAMVARVPMALFARAALPAQSVAFASSSSIASLPALVDGAERVLEVPKRVSGFVVPLSVSMFKIAAPVSWTMGASFVAWFYGIPLGLGALATIAFAAIILAFAAPGVPRGGFLVLAPLFVSIGLPVEGIGILIAVDAIPDIFATVLNSTGYLAATTIVARQVKDRE